MRFFLVKLLLTLLGEYSPKCYTDINEERRDSWLMSLVISDGFQNYFKYRDLQILKTMGNGVDTATYNRLVGQRMELLYLIGISKDIYDKSKRQSKSGRERNNEDV